MASSHGRHRRFAGSILLLIGIVAWSLHCNRRLVGGVASAAVESTTIVETHDATLQANEPPPKQEPRSRVSCHTTHVEINDMQQLDRSSILDEFNLAQHVQIEERSDDATAVACAFIARPNSNHFAHAMQQLYGCWSYLQQFRDDESIRAAILMPPNLQQRLRQNAFLAGFLSHMPVRNQLRGARTIVSINVTGGYVLQHADRLLPNLRSTPNTDCDNPRVTVLNRRRSKGRSLIHAEEWNATVAYFEGKSFEEQIRTLQQTDILLSPHGAQLTGLPLLGGSCASVLEFFPKAYAIPEFYGSLAIAAGRRYHYVSLSDGNRFEEQAQTMRQRVQARAANLCPAPDDVANFIATMVKEWKQCCISMNS